VPGQDDRLERKLAALKCLTDPAVRRQLLRDSLPRHPELWGADLEVLRYKPERRLVAQLRAPDGSRALLKLYHAGDFERARAGAEAFSRGALRSAPLLGVHADYHVLIWRWLEAACDATLHERPALAEDIGRALVMLHKQPVAALPPLARADEGRPLWAAAEFVAHLLPELAGRVERLAVILDTQLRAAPALRVPVHGDFSADQVVWTPAGAAIIDLDAAALGDPAWDLGTFAAQLELDALRGTLEAETAARIRAAFEDGYAAARGALPPRTALYTAAGLLRLAPHAFRTRQPQWPEETSALIARAEALL